MNILKLLLPLITGLVLVSCGGEKTTGNTINDSTEEAAKRPIDTSSPTISISTQNDISTTGSISFTGRADDNKGVKSVVWTTSTGTTGTATISGKPTSVTWVSGNIQLVDGANYITFKATDAVGLTASIMVSIEYKAPDTTKPVISVTSTGGSDPNNGNTLVSGSATDNVGVTAVTWVNSLGGSGTATLSGSTWTATIPASIGTNVITFTAIDVATNIGTTSTTIIRNDVTPPVIAITSQSNLNADNTVIFSGSMTDNVGVASVTWVNSLGGSGTATLSGSTWTANVGMLIGNNTITFTAIDAANNKTTVSATVTRNPPPDITPPVILVASQGSISSTGVVAINGSVTDNVAVSSVSWTNSAGGTGTATVTNSNWVANVQLSIGSNTITFTATDSSNNKSTTSVTVVRPDTVPPVITITSQGTVSSSGVVVINGSVSDNIGVKSVTWATDTGTGTATITGSTWTANVQLVIGVNTITFTAKDASDNASTTSATATRLDVTSPVITITNQGTIDSTGKITFTGSATDDVAVSDVVWVNGSSTGAAVLTGSTWSATVPLQYGSNSITFTATDPSNNKSSTSVTVTRPDTVPPTIAVTNLGTITSAGVISITGTVSDNVGVESVAWSMGSTTGSATIISGTWNASITLPYGSNTVTFTATDTFGNKSSTTSSVTRPDTIPPTITVTNQSTVSSTGTVTYTGSATDNVSVSTVTWVLGSTTGNATLNGNTWTATVQLAIGSNEVTFTAIDEYGNKTSTVATTLRPDITPPTITTTNQSVIDSSGNISITGTASDNIQVTSVTWVLGSTTGNATLNGNTWTATIPLQYGTNTVTFTATDSSNNKSTTSATITRADSTPPVIAVTTQGTVNSLGVIVISGTVTDNTSVTSVTWANSGGGTGSATITETNWSSTIQLAIGSNTITFTATDSSNNKSTTSVTVTRPDTVPPTIAITSQGTVNSSGVVVVNGSVSDNVGVASVTWTNGSSTGSAVVTGASWTANVQLVLGSNAITFTATDLSGNKTTTNTTIVRPDITAPLISVTSQGTVNSNGTVTISGTATDNVAVTSVTWALGSTTGNATLTGSNWSAIIPVQYGSNSITFTASDAAGNNGTTTTTVVRADTVQPVLTILTKGTPDTNGNAIVTGSVTDNVSVSSVVWVNSLGGTGSATVTGSNWSANIPTIVGNNIITFTATDSSSNTATATTSITRNPPPDTTAPTITIGTTGTPDSSGISVISGTATDNIGVTSITWNNSLGGTGTAVVTGTTSATWAANVQLVVGSNVITFTARDAANNQTTSTVTVTRNPPPDTTAPTLTINTPSAPDVNGSVSVTGSATDNVSVTTITWSNSTGGSGSASLSNINGGSNITWNVNSIQLVVGDNILTFVASDAAGNRTTKQITINRPPPPDTTVPIIGVGSTGTVNSTTGVVIITGTASDNVGVTSVTWSNSLGGTGSATISGTTIVSWSASIQLAVGTNVITFTAKDAANNQATTTATVVRNPPPDTTAPTISITSQGIVDSTGKVTISGTASDNVSVISVSWTNYSGGSGTATMNIFEGGPNVTWIISNLQLTTGNNLIVVTASDAAGNKTGTSVTINRPDISPPTISITSQGTPSNNSVLIQGSVTDNVGVSSVMWSNSLGGTGTATITGSTWNANVFLANGSNIITFTARDASNNQSTVTATISNGLPPDTTAPTITVTSYSAMDSNGYITVNGAAADNVGVQSVAWSNSLGGTGGATVTGTTTATWYTAPIQLKPGSNVITFTVSDTSTNRTTIQWTFDGATGTGSTSYAKSRTRKPKVASDTKIAVAPKEPQKIVVPPAAVLQNNPYGQPPPMPPHGQYGNPYGQPPIHMHRPQDYIAEFRGVYADKTVELDIPEPPAELHPCVLAMTLNQNGPIPHPMMPIENRYNGWWLIASFNGLARNEKIPPYSGVHLTQISKPGNREVAYFYWARQLSEKEIGIVPTGISTSDILKGDAPQDVQIELDYITLPYQWIGIVWGNLLPLAEEEKCYK